MSPRLMGLATKAKRFVGLDEETAEEYRCRDCGATFESNVDPDSVWLECEECGSDDVERVGA